MKYELEIFGAVSFSAYGVNRPARKYRTLGAAKKAANKVHKRLGSIGVSGAHPAIIHGPDLGRDGLIIIA